MREVGGTIKQLRDLKSHGNVVIHCVSEPKEFFGSARDSIGALTVGFGFRGMREDEGRTQTA